MTHKMLQERLPFMNALMDGEEVEHFDARYDQRWATMDPFAQHDWTNPHLQFRMKPKPQELWVNPEGLLPGYPSERKRWISTSPVDNWIHVKEVVCP